MQVKYKCMIWNTNTTFLLVVVGVLMMIMMIIICMLVLAIFCLSRNTTFHLTNFSSLQFILVHLASDSAQGEDNALKMAASKGSNNSRVSMFAFCQVVHFVL